MFNPHTPSREDVSGPPGWRTASQRSADAGYENRMPYPPSNMNESLKPVYIDAIDKGEDPLEAVQAVMGRRRRRQAMPHEPKWDDDAGDWAVPTLEEDMTGQVGEGFEPVRPVLGGTDRRWVKLESARFVAANTDAVDDSHELATRAHHHASVKTSTFTPQRSAAVCEAFVAEVTRLGQAQHRPRRTAAAPPSIEFDDQAMYLL